MCAWGRAVDRHRRCRSKSLAKAAGFYDDAARRRESDNLARARGETPPARLVHPELRRVRPVAAIRHVERGVGSLDADAFQNHLEGYAAFDETVRAKPRATYVAYVSPATAFGTPSDSTDSSGRKTPGRTTMVVSRTSAVPSVTRTVAAPETVARNEPSDAGPALPVFHRGRTPPPT